jgi:hypothetical protein
MFNKKQLQEIFSHYYAVKSKHFYCETTAEELEALSAVMDELEMDISMVLEDEGYDSDYTFNNLCLVDKCQEILEALNVLDRIG